jgi:L-rhamnose mutarotase
MQRICFALQVKPERLEEYKARHRSVWPEMLTALRETGWNNYSLFWREDGLLVGYLETEDFERSRSGMALREVNELATGDARLLRSARRSITGSHNATARRSFPFITERGGE